MVRREERPAPERRAEIDQAIAELDINDSNSILVFGTAAQEEVTSVADEMLEGVRNNVERLKGRAIAGPHGYEQIPALVDRSVLRVKNFLADLNQRLGQLSFVAGDKFSAADITALVTIDFAKALDISVPEEHRALASSNTAASCREQARPS